VVLRREAGGSHEYRVLAGGRVWAPYLSRRVRRADLAQGCGTAGYPARRCDVDRDRPSACLDERCLEPVREGPYPGFGQIVGDISRCFGGRRFSPASRTTVAVTSCGNWSSSSHRYWSGSTTRSPMSLNGSAGKSLRFHVTNIRARPEIAAAMW
jgi:hypothetical protein